MTRFLKTLLIRFGREETGSMVVPFALWFPLFAAILFSAIEIGAVSLRHTVLEAALDDAVREIRLGTGTITSHDDVKDKICAQATILPDCATTLRLEMKTKDMRNFTPEIGDPDCIDVALPIQPVRSFQNGTSNQTMLMIACYRYKPVVSHLGLGVALKKDSSGNTTLFSSTAFVQEPT